MSWRKVEEPGPIRHINGFRYIAWHNPEQFPNSYIYVEDNPGQAGGSKQFVSIHDSHDAAVEAARAFVDFRHPSGGRSARIIAGSRKEKWWVTFEIDSVE